MDQFAQVVKGTRSPVQAPVTVKRLMKNLSDSFTHRKSSARQRITLKSSSVRTPGRLLYGDHGETENYLIASKNVLLQKKGRARAD